MMGKWEPFDVIGITRAGEALKALRINKPQYLWRTKKVGGLAGLFSHVRIEKKKR
jgi:hypothetical protein